CRTWPRVNNNPSPVGYVELLLLQCHQHNRLIDVRHAHLFVDEVEKYFVTHNGFSLRGTPRRCFILRWNDSTWTRSSPNLYALSCDRSDSRGEPLGHLIAGSSIFLHQRKAVPQIHGSGAKSPGAEHLQEEQTAHGH